METEQYYVIQRRNGDAWVDWIKQVQSVENKEAISDIFARWKHLPGYRLIERTDDVIAVGGS